MRFSFLRLVVPKRLGVPKRVTWKDVREEILRTIEEERKRIAIISPLDYEDLLTNHKIKIMTSPYYTTLSVDDREYYFKRETGEFDGTGFPVRAH